ncbi:MAG: hypothetical protein ACREBC_25420, partial [Pyrinomonadaceae bacterium]
PGGNAGGRDLSTEVIGGGIPRTRLGPSRRSPDTQKVAKPQRCFWAPSRSAAAQLPLASDKRAI